MSFVPGGWQSKGRGNRCHEPGSPVSYRQRRPGGAPAMTRAQNSARLASLGRCARSCHEEVRWCHGPGGPSGSTARRKARSEEVARPAAGSNGTSPALSRGLYLLVHPWVVSGSWGPPGPAEVVGRHHLDRVRLAARLSLRRRAGGHALHRWRRFCLQTHHRHCGDTAQWVPLRSAARCTYAIRWVAVKYRWRLTIDSAERSALSSHPSSACGDITVTKPARPPRVG